nr:TPA_asm: P overlapped [Pogostemom alphacytorhabdovirus 3_Pog]
MKFIVNLIVAVSQWYILFIFDLIKAVCLNPRNLTTWSTVWPHLVILLIILKTLMTAIYWILLCLRLLYLMIIKSITIIKMIYRILR